MKSVLMVLGQAGLIWMTLAGVGFSVDYFDKLEDTGRVRGFVAFASGLTAGFLFVFAGIALSIAMWNLVR